MTVSDPDEAAKSRPLPEDILKRAEIVSKPRKISGALHPLDYMFWFIYDDPDRVDKLDAPILYFDSGKQVVEFLRQLLNEDRVKAILKERDNKHSPLAILEFASGYGRASRHFANELPGLELVACDVHKEAVAFLESMGINACLSSSIPEQLDTGRRFDIVFALSFFTHMPRATWTRWLGALAAQLEPDGVLIFTAHGEVSQALMGVAALEQDGFFYGPWSEQKDLPLDEYGGTITSFDFVYRQLIDCGLTLVQYKQTAIAHHDVYVVQKRRDDKYLPLSSELDSLKQDNQKLVDELKALHLSRSWQITAPIRRLARALGRP